MNTTADWLIFGLIVILVLLLDICLAVMKKKAPAQDASELWRICDGCLPKNLRPAMVWCSTHGVYLCEDCIDKHSQPCCVFLSQAAAEKWKKEIARHV